MRVFYRHEIGRRGVGTTLRSSFVSRNFVCRLLNVNDYTFKFNQIFSFIYFNS